MECINGEPVVTIPVSRYEELVECEIRIEIAAERLINDECCSTEWILRILGTSAAIKKANEMKAEDEKRRLDELREYEDIS